MPVANNSSKDSTMTRSPQKQSNTHCKSRTTEIDAIHATSAAGSTNTNKAFNVSAGNTQPDSPKHASIMIANARDAGATEIIHAETDTKSRRCEKKAIATTLQTKVPLKRRQHAHAPPVAILIMTSPTATPSD